MNKDGVSVDDVLRKKKFEKCSQSEFSKTNEPYVCKRKRGSIEYQGKHVIISKYITIVKI